MCRERLHILSFSGDNVCRVRQNVPLKVHILSPATNCAGATKCAVTDVCSKAVLIHISGGLDSIFMAFIHDVDFCFELVFYSEIL